MQSSRTFRIFVSSTFSDLKAEYNALQEKELPHLGKLCQVQGSNFQAIDLRWGDHRCGSRAWKNQVTQERLL